jgi:hypothetical protein
MHRLLEEGPCIEVSNAAFSISTSSIKGVGHTNMTSAWLPDSRLNVMLEGLGTPLQRHRQGATEPYTLLHAIPACGC